MTERYVFRGKRIDNGEWVQGYYFADTGPCTLRAAGKCACKHNGSEVYIVSWQDDCHEYEEKQVVPSTIGQSTGLRDKNGKLIFEGDIVFVSLKNDYPWKPNAINKQFVAIWHDDVAQFGLKPVCGNQGLILEKTEQEHYEIIGNIHDNPELQEGTK